MIRSLSDLEDWLAGAALAVCFGAVSLELISRSVFGYSFLWTEELSRYLLIWVTYLGAVGAVRENTHIRVEFIYKRLSHPWQKITHVATLLLCGGFTAIMTWVGYRLTWQTFSLGLMSADSNLPVPIWVFQAVIPIGFGIMTLRLLSRSYRALWGSC